MKLVDHKIEIPFDEILDSLTKEEKYDLAGRLIWDKEIFDDFVDALATDTVVTSSFNSWTYQARLRLMELLPKMNQEIIRSLLHELDEAKEDARRHTKWAYAMFHAWPTAYHAQRPKLEPLESTKFRTDAEIAEVVGGVEEAKVDA